MVHNCSESSSDSGFCPVVLAPLFLAPLFLLIPEYYVLVPRGAMRHREGSFLCFILKDETCA